MTIVDGTTLYHDAIKRIQQLERLNATLSAQVDRMRSVVEAAEARVQSLSDIHPDGLTNDEIVLATRVRLYQREMVALAKGGQNGQ